MRSFDTLSEQEVLALAISLEEEDERIYADFAEGLREEYPATAKVFAGMREEESGHRRRLIELYRQKFGEHIPLIRRQDVKGFVQRRPVWLARPLRLNAVRNQAAAMEEEVRQFYERAAARATDASIRQLLDDLAEEERSHECRAEQLEKTELKPERPAPGRRGAEKAARPADRAAGPGGTDGWFGVHAGAGIRGRVRHAQQLDGVRGGPRGLAGRRH